MIMLYWENIEILADSITHHSIWHYVPAMDNNGSSCLWILPWNFVYESKKCRRMFGNTEIWPRGKVELLHGSLVCRDLVLEREGPDCVVGEAELFL